MQQKGIGERAGGRESEPGRYKVQDAKYDPFGNLTQPASVFDTSTAQFLNQPGGFQAPMSIDQATEQATREASERAGILVPTSRTLAWTVRSGLSNGPRS